MYPLSTWRLLVHAPADGAWNMAVDEAILRSVAEGRSPATLRFYGWEPPCLSLGRSQPADIVDFDACDRAGFTVVRRPTGGRAILHRDELTYSVCLRLDDPRARGDVLESYRRLSEGLAEGLSGLGLDVQTAPPQGRGAGGSAACFDMPGGHEILVAGRKLLGSAQFRSRNVLLQHGSLPLVGDIGGIVDLLALSEPDRAFLRRRLQAGATTLEEAAGRTVAFAEVMEALCQGVASVLNVRLEQGALTDKEERVAEALSTDKYGAVEPLAGARLSDVRAVAR